MGKNLGAHLAFSDARVNAYRWLLGLAGVIIILMGHASVSTDGSTYDPIFLRYVLGASLLLISIASYSFKQIGQHLALWSIVALWVISLWALFLVYQNINNSLYWVGLVILAGFSGMLYTDFRQYLFYTALLLSGSLLVLMQVDQWTGFPWGLLLALPFILGLNGLFVHSRLEGQKKIESLAAFSLYNPTPIMEIGSLGEILYANEVSQQVFPDLLEIGYRHPIIQRVVHFHREHPNQPQHNFEMLIEDRAYEVFLNFVPESESYHLYFTDTTAQKDFREELQDREERFRMLVQGTNEALILTDTENNILLVNHQFLKLFGFKDESEVVNQNAVNLLMSDVNPEIIRRRHQDRLKGISDVYEIEQKRKNGDSIWTLVSASPFRDRNGNIIGTIAALTNITELKEVEKMLKERNEQMDLFLYKATHDLKGPLASIQGILNIALSESNQPEVNNYMQMAIISAERLDNALVDLIQVTRMNKADFKMEEIYLEDVVQEILDSIDHMAEREGVDYHVHIGKPDAFISDRASLSSILQNLIVNATKYKQPENENHEVSIDIQPYQAGIMIEVRDNGEGIGPEIQKKIFHMFYRGNKRSKGTGLGLYIVKQTTEKLKGSVTVASQPGIGTTFSIYIPEADKSVSETADSPSSVQEPARNFP